MQGLVIENISNLYKIQVNEYIYEAVARGKIKKEEISPVVGDIVEIEITDKENKKAVIEKIHSRNVYIKRPKMANLTQLIFVVSSKQPKPDLLLLDKQLAYANYLNVNAIIVLNKTDLDDKQEFEKIKNVYKKIGYKVLETKAKEGNGIKELIDIMQGNINAFSGNSGVGKSTLIKLILKEEEPTSGNIIINGKDTTFLKPNRIPYLRRSMGVVFQDFRLLPDKTVYDNVAYAMYIVRATPRHIRRQVPMVLSLVGLSGKAKMYPNELSGGEQQRVALARALVNNPSMLIADEPTGNLYPETAWDIMNLLNDINMRGTTVVVATHAKDIVDKMKKRVIHIRKGEIIRDDKKGGYDCEI